MLNQRFDDTGLEHLVGFISKALRESELNYAAYKLEMYAVVRAVKHFCIFFLGQKLLLRTDHAGLVKPLRRDVCLTSRVERWKLRLSDYTFSIQHQPGIDNVMADVFPRLLFACSSVLEFDLSLGESRNHRTTRNTKGNKCNGSSSNANRPGPFAFYRKNSSLNFQSVSRPTLSD